MKLIYTILLLLICGVAWGDTVTLYPDGAVYTGISNKSGCSANWECVSDQNHSSYIYIVSAGQNDWYTMDDSSVTGTISNVELRVQVSQWGTTPQVRLGLKVGTSYSVSGLETITSTTSEWHTKSWSTSPNTSTTWTWSEIDSLQAYLYLRASANYAMGYEVELIVTYTPSSSRRIMMIH